MVVAARARRASGPRRPVVPPAAETGRRRRPEAVRPPTPDRPTGGAVARVTSAATTHFFRRTRCTGGIRGAFAVHPADDNLSSGQWRTILDTGRLHLQVAAGTPPVRGGGAIGAAAADVGRTPGATWCGRRFRRSAGPCDQGHRPTHGPTTLIRDRFLRHASTSFGQRWCRRSTSAGW